MTEHRFIRALQRQPVDKTPVWIMRQAGRYLPEYREVRSQVKDFMQLCSTPELACEVTLQPLRRFELDAAILFSDILTIPHAMNLGLEFIAGKGPTFSKPVRDENAVLHLPIPDPEEDLGYVMDAIRLIKKTLNDKTPLIGFAGSPWTVATYMVEGGSSKQFSVIKRMLYRDPDLLHALLEKVTLSTISYLQAQIAAGVDAIMIFDTWGGVLTPEAYQTFSLQYMQRIIDALPNVHEGKTIPTILFTKPASPFLELLANSGCDAVGLDWTISLAEARSRVGDRVALQGNLDPAILHAEPEIIKAEVNRILKEANNTPGHIFNLGHGITPDINPDHVSVLVDAVHAGIQS
jgi:uroporphyrinogen decarboxylase